MLTEEEIKNRIKENEEYLEEYHSKRIEYQNQILKLVLTTPEEDIMKYYNILVETVEPFYTFEQRKAQEEKAEEFYRTKVKPCKSKKREELVQQWKDMYPPSYDEYKWEAYNTMKFVVEGKEVY